MSQLIETKASMPGLRHANKVAADGLRYTSRKAGSIFNQPSHAGAAVLSCFLCGKHRGRSNLKTRKMFGSNQAVCAPSCKELEAQLQADE